MKKSEKYRLGTAFWDIFRANPALFLTEYAFMALSSILTALTAPVMQELFERLLSFTAGNEKAVAVIMAAILLFLVNVCAEIADGIGNYCGELYYELSLAHFMEIINLRIARLAPIDFEDSRKLDLINKSYRSAVWVRQCLNTLIDLLVFYVPYILVTGAWLYRQDRQLVAIFPLICIPIIVFWKFKLRSYDELEQKTARVRRRKEYFAGCILDREYFKETKVLGAASRFYEKMCQEQQEYCAQKTESGRKNLKLNIAQRVPVLAGYLGILALLAHQVWTGKITVAAFAAIFAALQTMFGLMEEMLCSRTQEFISDYAAAKRFIAFMNLPTAQDGEHTLTDGIASIEFRNVSFTYPDGTSALENISFTVTNPSRIAVVGENGSGKTTLLKLMTGIYQPTAGEIYVNRIPLKDFKKGSLWDCISAMVQFPGRYKMSVLENIALGDSSREPDRKLAGACMPGRDDSLLQQLDMDTLLGPELDGIDLSGGMWQQLSLARLAYRMKRRTPKQMTVLDEPTSAIDPMKEREILNDIEELTKDSLAVIVTHRMGSVRFCDRVLVLEHGRLAGSGTHEELLAQNAVYARLWHSQADMLR